MTAKPYRNYGMPTIGGNGIDVRGVRACTRPIMCFKDLKPDERRYADYLQWLRFEPNGEERRKPQEKGKL